MLSRRFLPVLLLLLVALAPPALGKTTVAVFAAASMKDALGAIAAAIDEEQGIALRPSFASSSTLARQIEAGAPADIFISANVAWMDYLAERGLVDPASRRDIAGNTLVLIAPEESAAGVDASDPGSIAAALGDGRLALGDPAHVPAGRYAREALEAMGAWETLASRIAPTDNVRVALAYVARGEAQLGIVYGSDAAAEPAVRVLATLDARLHTPILYPAAMVAASADPRAARAVLDFLAGERAAAILAASGFAPLP